MTEPTPNIGQLSRNFVIPPGSQVVLQVTCKTSTGDFRKPGAVGVVVESPPHNDENYLVEFNDRSTVNCPFDDLRLRRREIDILLDQHNIDWEQHVIYRCRVGSRAFGLATEDSDDDIRGIYLPPADAHWALFSIPEQIEKTNEDEDEVYWELEKFIRLALKANPNILETLWTPHLLLETPVSKELREIRSAFLSKHVFKTYSGYVISQLRRMNNRFLKTGDYKKKHAMHLVRLLYSGIHAVLEGEILVDVSTHRDELMDIRMGNWSLEQVRELARKLDREFQSAFDKTCLPDQPDIERVNAFLISARRSMI